MTSDENVWAAVSAIWRANGRRSGEHDLAVQVITAARNTSHPLHPLFDWTTPRLLLRQAAQIIEQARRAAPGRAGGKRT